ncbi:hypothetical protein LCGC14_1957670 [marine sediment metagenome]|uniref:Phage portal protein n=1 Tax=marine sediment metagenome TaxID=412755 RepID=A0A0F9ICM4_9ZZZZ
MPETNIAGASAGNVSGTIVDYSVDPVSTDGAGGVIEFTYQNTDWSQDYGYYKTIPEFKTAINAKATWTVGAGFTSDEATELLLMNIKGNGKDSFNSILKNMIKCKTISKDSFAEVIRDGDGVLANLKPLDPESIVIVQNRKGRIVRYEQVSKTDIPNKRFGPDRIFHLSHERMADEVHGTRIIDSLKWLILARNEAMNDWKRVLHRNIDPLWIFHLDTDDTAEITAFKAKMDGARKNGENMYVPKGAVVPELVTTATNASLNPLAWIAQLNDYFFQAVNVPQIIIGNAKEFTDASGKIVYLSYEQSVKGEQLYIEEQVLAQLNVEIALTFPASLQNELISDTNQESDLQASQPNDTTAELEGPT